MNYEIEVIFEPVKLHPKSDKTREKKFVIEPSCCLLTQNSIYASIKKRKSRIPRIFHRLIWRHEAQFSASTGLHGDKTGSGKQFKQITFSTFFGPKSKGQSVFLIIFFHFPEFSVKKVEKYFLK